MPWFKYRENSSSGSSKWKFHFISDEEYAKWGKNTKSRLEEEILNVSNANTDSEHWRGIDIKKIAIETIPREVLESRLKDAKDALKWALQAPKFHRKRIKFLRDEAKKCKVIEVRVRCKSCKGKGKTKFQDRILDCHYCDKTGKVKTYTTW